MSPELFALRQHGCALALAMSCLASTASAQESQRAAQGEGQSSEAAPDNNEEPSEKGEPINRAPVKVKSVDGSVIVEVGAYKDTNAVEVLTPSVSARLANPTAGWSANGRYLVDVVSAASPDIVSTASPRWTEIRNAGSLGAQYKPGDFGVSLGSAASYTPDYLALNANAQFTLDLFQKNTTLVGGYGYGHDVIGRTGTPFSVFSHKLDYHSISGGLSQVVNESVVLGLVGDAIIERGDQSKPYRHVPMFTAADAARLGAGAGATEVADARIQAKPLEQLPLERERFALTGRLGWRFSRSTLRLEERFYVDTWGLRASTTDARFFVDLSERITIWPHLRANVQNGVSFYQRTYVAMSVADLPALRTGDRELSPLISGTVGGGIRWRAGRIGGLDDIVLQATLDSVYTRFIDALYVSDRLAFLLATTMEVPF